LTAAQANPDDGLIELRVGNRHVLVAPRVGGAIAAFYDMHEGRALHWLRPATAAALDARDPLGMASFPLLPYCNRIRDARFSFDGREIDLSGDGNAFEHALHGHAWRRAWRVGKRTPDSVELHFRHEPSRAPGEHWPFRYEATQRLTVSDEGLAVTLSARNLSDRPMPFGMGHHPYYPRTPATRVHTDADAMWHSTPDLLPTHLGAHPSLTAMRSPEGMAAGAFDLDNNFAGWSRSATIAWPDEGRAVTLLAEAPFDHTVVYAPQAHPDLLCVEPVSNTVDWINLDGTPATTGGCVLHAGESIAGNFQWRPASNISK
jgi:aldose 1-epimerase